MARGSGWCGWMETCAWTPTSAATTSESCSRNTGGGDPGVTFYSGAISNCAIGIMAQDMPSALGRLMFANFTLDDDLCG